MGEFTLQCSSRRTDNRTVFSNNTGITSDIIDQSAFTLHQIEQFYQN